MFFIDNVYLGNTVKDYLLFFGISSLGFILGKIVYYISKTWLRRIVEKTKTKLGVLIIDILEEPIVFLFIILFFSLGIKRLNIPEFVETIASKFVVLGITVSVSWFLIRLVDSLIKHYLEPRLKKTKSELDDQMVPMLRKGLKITIITLTILVLLDNLGYNVTSLLAGLGIGGLAIAMASKDTLDNFISSFFIFSDKPFTVGDRVKVFDVDGTVVEVGVRSTKIRTLDGRIVTIPNSKVSKNVIENVSSEPSRKVVINFKLVHKTSSKKLEKAKKLLEKAVKSTKGTDKDKIFIGFTEFAESGLNLLLVYYITDKSNILGIKDEVNSRIKQSFEKAKIEFAYPTRTVELKK